MDYKRIYDDLMETRLSVKKERIGQKKQGSYFERHHIIPLSMGGNKSYALGSDNIVLLTAREHYIAHRMLWLIYRTREMGFAFHKMVFSTSPLQKRRFDSKAYEAAKLALSQCQRGENNPMWGKGSLLRGKPNINKGKKTGPRPDMYGDKNPSRREDVRKKLSEKLKGLKKPPMSEETKNKISARTKGSGNPRFGKYKFHFTDIEIFEYSAKNGIFIKKWNNIIEASEFYDIDRREIYRNTEGRTRSYNKSMWLTKYMGENINPYDYLKNYKRVIEYGPTGKIINSWESLKQASKETGLSKRSISYSIKHKGSCGNRTFSYEQKNLD